MGLRLGTVTAFDDPRGLGEVTGDDGEVVPFHCTGLADGSRAVAEGARVAYEVVPGLQGRREARGIVKL